MEDYLKMEMTRKGNNRKINSVTVYNTEEYWGTVGNGLSNMPQQTPSGGGGQPSGGGGVIGAIVAAIVAPFIPEKDRKKR